MAAKDDEEERLRAVALQNAQSILLARRRAEEALRKQSEWLRITLASIGDAVISSDVEGRVTFMNGVAEALTGWSQSEAQGRPLAEVFRIINEETREPVENPAARALREGAVVRLANHTLLLARDGSERAVDDSAAPIRNTLDRVAGCVLIFRDVRERRKLEIAVAQAKSYAEDIVATVREPLLVLDAELRVRSANRSYYSLFQTRPEDTENRPLYELGDGHWNIPELRGLLGEILFKNSSVDDFEVDCTFPTIGPKVMLLNARRIYRESNRTGLILLAIADATARKRAEETAAERGRLTALRADVADALAQGHGVAKCMQECVEALVKHLGLAFARIWTLDDTQGVLELRASAGMYTHLDGPHGRIRVGDYKIGRIAQSRRPHLSNSVPEDPEVSDPEWARREGMVAFAGYPLSIERRVLGVLAVFARRRLAEATLSELAPLADGIAQWLIRQRAEEALREREQRLSALLKQVAVGIAQVDLTGRFLFVNERFADLLGRSVGEMLTLRMQSVTHPDHVRESADVLAGVSASGRSQVIEKRYLRPDGTSVWTLTSVAAVAGDDDRSRSVVALVQDITDRKRAENELRDADRGKNEFLAMLAHELRNPLAPVRNALQMIRMMTPEPQKAIGDAYDLIERQIEHLVRLVDDLLDVSRITTGKIQLQTERVELATVLSRAIEGARPLIDARRHTLEVALADDALMVNADPVRLAQVVWNLLNNAAKYTPEQGRIWLTAGKEQGQIVVRVRDSGLGIPTEMLPKVFDLFTQMDRTLARAEGGLGIGLTLVRRLTEMHGGSVVGSSQGPGQGSEFIVHLPAPSAEAPKTKSQTASRAAARAGPASGKRILVVDDNRDSAESLAMLLRLFGNDVRTAHDGRLALEIVQAYSPDVVLLDIGLPELDGLEVCRRIRAQSTAKQPLIVAMTGYGQEEDRRRSAEAGFSAHMVKPVDLAALKELLSRPDFARSALG